MYALGGARFQRLGSVSNEHRLQPQAWIQQRARARQKAVSRSGKIRTRPDETLERQEAVSLVSKHHLSVWSVFKRSRTSIRKRAWSDAAIILEQDLQQQSLYKYSFVEQSSKYFTGFQVECCN